METYLPTRRTIALFSNAADQMITSGFCGRDSRGRALTTGDACDSVREGIRILKAVDAAAKRLELATLDDLDEHV